MRLSLFGLLLGLASTTALAQAPAVEGTDYNVIDPPQPTASSERIEVIEAFGYSCPACARLQPLIDAWKPKLPADVEFSYMPASWGGVWEQFGRAFYAAQSLGVLDKSHSEIFKRVHIDKKPVAGPEDIAALYEEFGVSKEDFLATMNSFAVNTRIGRAKQQMPRYGVEGTPTLIINGKYRVNLTQQGGFERMIEVADQLIARERQAMATGS